MILHEVSEVGKLGFVSGQAACAKAKQNPKT